MIKEYFISIYRYLFFYVWHKNKNNKYNRYFIYQINYYFENYDK